jgi:hypothetical protein
VTINNAELFMAGVWDWAILDGCFGATKIKPTDIDGAIERNGKYLFIETKQPTAGIPQGQGMFYEGQVLAGNSVLFVWGEKNCPVRLRIITPNIDRTIDPAGTDEFRKVVQQWFEWADKQPRIRYRNW